MKNNVDKSFIFSIFVKMTNKISILLMIHRGKCLAFLALIIGLFKQKICCFN